MAKSNFIIRGGADFSDIQKEVRKTQSQISEFQSSITKSMGGIGKIIKFGLGIVGLNAIKNFVKDSINVASDLTEVQNVVDVTFGKMAKDINEFADTAIEQFGLSVLSAKKFTSTMGAMLKSSGITGTAVRDMSIDLTKLSADMASFYNLENEEAFRKIMSGMSGMTMPLKELGVNMNIANLEAFALANGIKTAYKDMSQAEQVMLRYNYLMSVTSDSHNDFARNAHTWANQLKILGQQWEMVKASIGEGFINILLPIVSAFNKVIAVIAKAAAYFKAFTELIFGKASKGGTGAVVDAYGDVGESIGGVGGAGSNASKGLDKAGKSAKKAGKNAEEASKKAKNGLAGFDELNKLADNTTKEKSPSGGSGGSGIGGADPLGGGGVDFGSAAEGEVDLGLSKIEEDLKRLMGVLTDFYNNWGLKDIFEGIKEGAKLVDFNSIGENFKKAFSNLGEIAQTALIALQPIAKASGELIGTHFKYGIAIAGNYYEPIIEGFANFTENMKGPIQKWLLEISSNITNGLKNLKGAWEIVYQAWLEVINKYKPQIAKAVEDTFTNMANTIMGIGTILSEIYETITAGIYDFINDNKERIKGVIDDIHSMVLGLWDLINQVWKDSIDMVMEWWNEWGKGIVDTFVDVVQSIGDWLLTLWEETVKPIWDKMLSWLSKLWNETFKDVVKELLGFVGRVAELLGLVWENSLKPIVDKLVEIFGPAFATVFSAIMDIVGNTVQLIGEIIKNLLKILNGIIDFMTGAFTGDWDKAWEGVSKIFDGFKGIIDGIVKAIKGIFKGIIDFIAGIFKAGWETAWNGIKSFFSSTGTALGKSVDLIKEVYNKFLTFVKDTFKKGWETAWNGIKTFFGSFKTDIDTLVGGIKTIFDGLVSFITGVFTGNWRRAWEGVVNVFGTIFNGLKALFTAPINFIIDGINTFLRGMNKIKIPDWVPGVGGKGFNISEIPRLAKGGVIDSPTIAMVGEAGKEVVMPLENNTGWINDLASKISENGGGGGDLHLTIKIGEDTITDKVIKSINRESRKNGKPVIQV